MDELEQTLNRVLSDPAELEKISRLASELLGGGEGGTAPASPGVPEALRGLLGGGGGTEDGKAALVRALAPYLREDRRSKLQKALRLARAAHLAGIAWNELGGGEGVGL